jgi:hypothetical protein
VEALAVTDRGFGGRHCKGNWMRERVANAWILSSLHWTCSIFPAKIRALSLHPEAKMEKTSVFRGFILAFKTVRFFYPLLLLSLPLLDELLF